MDVDRIGLTLEQLRDTCSAAVAEFFQELQHPEIRSEFDKRFGTTDPLQKALATQATALTQGLAHAIAENNARLLVLLRYKS